MRTSLVPSRLIAAFAAFALMAIVPFARGELHGVATGGGITNIALYEPQQPTEAELEDGVFYPSAANTTTGGCAFDKFDPDRGTLTRVEITIHNSIIYPWERSGPIGWMFFDGNGAVSSVELGINAVVSGSSGETWPDSTSGTIQESSEHEYVFTSDLSRFVGEGTVPLVMTSELSLAGNGSAADYDEIEASISGGFTTSVTVEYFYTVP